jgi:lantibiotic modifying enzyme
MAHGMPGILCFLAQVYALGIRQALISELIPACFSFLLMHRSEMEDWYCFPGFIELKPEPRPFPSRNGWCYGDLGMANALIHCGKALARADWVEFGVRIALKTTHIPFEASGCADAAFCHGAMGLVHQYNRIYRSTHNTQFKDAAGKWLEITRDCYYRPGQYIGGYAFRSYDEASGKHEFISSCGLLEGAAGIGLVLLGCDHHMPTDWDIIFQTNI